MEDCFTLVSLSFGRNEDRGRESLRGGHERPTDAMALLQSGERGREPREVPTTGLSHLTPGAIPPLSLPSSVAQPGGNGKRLGVAGWQRGCAWMPIVRVSQSLGTCGPDRSGHSSGHAKVPVLSASCPRQWTSHLPPSRGASAGCVFEAGSV